MNDFSESRFISVQQRCIEYKNLKMNYQNIQNGAKDIYKMIPINEDDLKI
jgi:hypothetical protein